MSNEAESLSPTPFGMAHITSGRNGGFRGTPITGFEGSNGGFRGTPFGQTTNTNTNTNTNSFPPSFEFGKDTTTTAAITCTKVEHTGIVCDKCSTNPIVGIRYRCAMCSNYDLCEKCMEEHERSPFFSVHDRDHLFYRIASPTQQIKEYPIVMSRDRAVHTGIKCSGCNVVDPKGYLYKCQECPNVNLCEACEAKGIHNPNHTRTKMAMPSRESQLLEESRAEVARLKKQLGLKLLSESKAETDTSTTPLFTF